MNNVLVIVSQFVFHAATVLFVARFLLQACRADFYNPISQGIVKATDPVLKPIRRVLPGYRNLDFASFLVAALAQMILLYILAAILGRTPGSILLVIVYGFIRVIDFLLKGYMYGIFIVIIASFIAPGSHHPALALLHQLIDPVLTPARKLLPSLGGLDFSPMLVLMLILVAQEMIYLPLQYIR